MTDDPAKRQRPLFAAGALFLNEQSQVLMVEPTYKSYWEIPGGCVEIGESPLEACKREIAEELGLKPHFGALLIADWAPNPDEGDKVVYIFDGGMLSAEQEQAITLQTDEFF